MEKIQITNGVNLTNILTDKFSSSLLSITFSKPISEVNPSVMSILPYILLRGSKKFENLTKINAKLDSLYGASIEPLIRKKGEYLCISFVATFINSDFASNEDLLEEVYDMVCEIIWNTLTENDEFNAEMLESEKNNLINRINNLKNDKRIYANTRMFEIMCSQEPYGLSRFGTTEQAENIDNKSLYKEYLNILDTAEVDIFYSGKENIKDIKLDKIKARNISEISIKTKFDKPNIKEVIETLDISQGKLSMGFRTNITANDENYPALAMFNTMLGGSTSSKLFENVREKMSLCYYASSGIDKIKGVMSINSGIEIKNFDIAKKAILKEFDDMQNGKFSDDEINSAKLTLINNLNSSKDDPFALEDFYLTNSILKCETSIDELKIATQKISKGDIINVAKNVFLDTIYFLKGEENDA